MFNLNNGIGKIEEGKVANFVGYNGDPLSTTSIIEVLGIHDNIKCKPIEK